MVEDRWVYTARRFTSIDLNPLSIHVTFTAIVPGAYTQGRPKRVLDSLDVAKCLQCPQIGGRRDSREVAK